MAAIRDVLTRTGAVATTAQLRSAGVPQRSIERAVRCGDLERLRRGVFAASGAHPAVVSALRAGGSLGCVSALAVHGAWSPEDRRIHVRIPRGSIALGTPGLVLHWSDERRAQPIDSVEAALGQAIRCLERRDALAVMDSAAHLGLLGVDRVVEVAARTARGRSLLAMFDPAAESGLETAARYALRARGIRVRTQVTIPAVGRVDLVIGDRLVLELDGAAWHGGVADFERDRARDRELIARGYLPMRATYEQVMRGWTAVEEQVLRVVRRDEHVWSTRQRRQLSRGRAAEPR